MKAAAFLLGALALSGCGGGASMDLGIDAGEGDLARSDGGGATGPDLEESSCKGTADDCGPRGACTNCASSSLGHQCIKVACGCVVAADCDPGHACVLGQCAAKGCGAMTPCHGGCCDSGSCVAGDQFGKCGSDGNACVVCGGGTPSCQGGACTAGCVAGKLGDPGVCGQGFCCGANDQCQTLADNACATAGAICRDCTQGAGGAKCLQGGSCGCVTAGDCQKGQACRGGVCGVTCDANSACNGGCCNGGQCADGTLGTACAIGNVLCANCAGNKRGSACVTSNNGGNNLGACGCNSQTDCGPLQACDPVAHTCSSACDLKTPCNGGCCQNGQCVAGTATNACGQNGGLCLDCGVNPNGALCVAVAGGGHCGCNDLGQCPNSATSCDANAKICDHSCSRNLPCQFGCCSDPNHGTCQNGVAANACGPGGLCADCTSAMAGHACRANQQCGCDQAADCPPGQACNPMTHACGTACGLNQQCNGGCCNGGSCASGMDVAACGAAGACVDCSKNRLGHSCLGGMACGCRAAADCGALQACDSNAMLCTAACGPNQPCNGGCCENGLCVDGTANSACGIAGMACTPCGGATPTCEGGGCTARCGAVGNGNCSGGNCCQGGQCVAGTVQSACGASGACLDCTGAPSGTQCIQPMGAPFFCGCTTKSDCRAAQAGMNIPGQACDTGSNTCATSCGGPGISGCNGGCCSGAAGQCRGGGQDSACGVSGGFCSDCVLSCNPGPVCNQLTGACGCAATEDCFFQPQCQIGLQREACSVPRGTCCVPAWFNGNVWEDSGNPANCCTGMSVKGICTCTPTGQPSQGDAATCCSQHEQAGTCSCLPNGAPCLGESDSNGECCSGQCVDIGNFVFQCMPSAAGQPCQSDAGCTPPLKCNNKNICA
jgi:hypothetical protein